MTLVINSWISGETSYLNGTRVDSTGNMDTWSCSTIDSNPFTACSWFGPSGPAYITQECYDSLTGIEKELCPSLYHGIVANSEHWTSHQVETFVYYSFNPECIVSCWSEECTLLLPVTENGTLFDIIIDNKEIVILGSIVGIILLKQR